MPCGLLIPLDHQTRTPRRDSLQHSLDAPVINAPKDAPKQSAGGSTRGSAQEDTQGESKRSTHNLTQPGSDGRAPQTLAEAMQLFGKKGVVCTTEAMIDEQKLGVGYLQPKGGTESGGFGLLDPRYDEWRNNDAEEFRFESAAARRGQITGKRDARQRAVDEEIARFSLPRLAPAPSGSARPRQRLPPLPPESPPPISRDEGEVAPRCKRPRLAP
eukprot:Hpha_TRINITY_DN37138_c0_g1::TRINITY_DN37138_c0_g1_i1::g.1580::m.1580